MKNFDYEMARKLFDAGWKASAKFCDRDDVVFDGIIGVAACPYFEQQFEETIEKLQKETATIENMIPNSTIGSGNGF